MSNIILADYTQKTDRRNKLCLYWMKLSSIGTGMLSLTTTLSYFIAQYRPNDSLFFATVISITSAAQAIPKLFAAKKLESRDSPYKSFITTSFLMQMIWLLLAAIIILCHNDRFILYSFFTMFVLYALLEGVSGANHIEVYSRVISTCQRGRFKGFQNSIENFFKFIGGLLGIIILKSYSFPKNYGYAFLLVALLGLLSLVPQALVKIPKSTSNQTSKPGAIRNIKEVINIYKMDKNLRYYIISRIFTVTGGTAKSFFIIYAIAKIRISAHQIALTNALFILGSALFSIVWGFLHDKFGAKFVQISFRMIALIPYVIMLNLSNVGSVYISFLIYSAASSGYGVTKESVYMFMSDKRAAMYNGIESIVLMPVVLLAPLLVSLSINNLGYNFTFIASIFLVLIGVLILHCRVSLAPPKND